MSNVNWKPFVFGGLASVTAECGTFPIDLAKTRLQVQGQVGDSKYREIRYRGMLHAIVRIGREEGPRALYSGSVWAIYVPACVLSCPLISVVNHHTNLKSVSVAILIILLCFGFPLNTDTSSFFHTSCFFVTKQTSMTIYTMCSLTLNHFSCFLEILHIFLIISEQQSLFSCNNSSHCLKPVFLK